MLAQTTLVNIMMTLKLVETQSDKKFIGFRAQVHKWLTVYLWLVWLNLLFPCLVHFGFSFNVVFHLG